MSVAVNILNSGVVLGDPVTRTGGIWTWWAARA